MRTLYGLAFRCYRKPRERNGMQICNFFIAFMILQDCLSYLMNFALSFAARIYHEVQSILNCKYRWRYFGMGKKAIPSGSCQLSYNRRRIWKRHKCWSSWGPRHLLSSIGKTYSEDTLAKMAGMVVDLLLTLWYRSRTEISTDSTALSSMAAISRIMGWVESDELVSDEQAHIPIMPVRSLPTFSSQGPALAKRPCWSNFTSISGAMKNIEHGGLNSKSVEPEVVFILHLRMHCSANRCCWKRTFFLFACFMK